MKNILVIGTSMHDIVFSAPTIEPNKCNKGNFTESYGGSMHNVSYNLASLGMNPIFITKLGNDTHATQIQDELALMGVEIVPFFVELPTPIFQSISSNTRYMLSSITPHFLFNENDNLDLSYFRDAYVITDQTNEKLLYHLMINSSSAKWICSGFTPSIPLHKYVTGVVLNEDEIVEDRITFEHGIKWIIITRGSKGAVLLTPEKQIVIPCTSINTTNTVGAGDAFLAGFIYGLSKNKSIEDSIQLAHQAASIILTTPSAISKDLATLKKLTQ